MIPLPGSLRFVPAWPFVGRSVELATLRSLQAETDGGRRVALVTGEAGVGKSRLIRELAHEAAAGGAVVLYGVCDPELAVPYQPFVESLDHLFRHTDAATLAADLELSGGELARLFPDLSARGLATPAVPTADPETARHRLHVAVSGLLGTASHRHPWFWSSTICTGPTAPRCCWYGTSSAPPQTRGCCSLPPTATPPRTSPRRSWTPSPTCVAPTASPGCGWPACNHPNWSNS